MPKKKKKKIERILNCIESPDTQNDWKIENAAAAGLLALPAQPPKSKDLRKIWWEIGDQGETGSCVGWATADSILRWHFVKVGKLEKDELLSPRFIWMAAKETDEFDKRPTTFIEDAGTSLKAALDIARNFGAVREKDLPFQPGALYRGDTTTFYVRAARYRIAMYINLGTDLDEWRTWLAEKGPILIRLEVDDTWDKAEENIGKLDLYKKETARRGHAAALVGYTPNTFIVRNSWGTSWGDQGFGYASLAYAQEAFTEAYGVIV